MVKPAETKSKKTAETKSKKAPKVESDEEEDEEEDEGEEEEEDEPVAAPKKTTPKKTTPKKAAKKGKAATAGSDTDDQLYQDAEDYEMPMPMPMHTPRRGSAASSSRAAPPLTRAPPSIMSDVEDGVMKLSLVDLINAVNGAPRVHGNPNALTIDTLSRIFQELKVADDASVIRINMNGANGCCAWVEGRFCKNSSATAKGNSVYCNVHYGAFLKQAMKQKVLVDAELPRANFFDHDANKEIHLACWPQGRAV
ncbi:hypothetical protein CAOG_06667 [Capsaspora owczarzaki ATCC 30864]|uniref:Uncharacterized protein n=1 Tax=Capsaspora owczarzaki (strain ATCC 30864) TaxID=595528 RepID=E9CF27_CAPO3|nr:hypothetical protein CAOG_08315 [Capsaspora owczarzaki ATCC 30864]XP_004344288.1 hypothetical protein CAOG_06667 [Capsaspora owczarzaki ATCC 30864]KJE96325.1 hypothetical protein CAOG_006667 [Capsaspora owczarzaki ATCC 30864]KJE98348.1 hypothetical protein CAOG_008315 [Capsaspora owczarzaki ATCC 30864]|eukprot:XP_004341260.1 hypothetical protein CAOG_08315 [Capsaspora owczarzaki ATCC 30864]